MFRDFRYRTQNSWRQERRVVGKAEHLAGGANPRFVVTSRSAEAVDARTLYEERYCARGEMENRIKEQKLLFACRDSCATMRANQIRDLRSTMAYVVMLALCAWLKGEGTVGRVVAVAPEYRPKSSPNIAVIPPHGRGARSWCMMTPIATSPAPPGTFHAPTKPTVRNAG